jgi:hypothetical protein
METETVKPKAASLKYSLVTSGPSEPRREMQVSDVSGAYIIVAIRADYVIP